MAKGSERKQGVINRLAEASRQRPQEQSIKASSVPPKIADGQRQETQPENVAEAIDTAVEPATQHQKNVRISLTEDSGNTPAAKARASSTGHHIGARQSTTSQPHLVRRSTSKSSILLSQKEEELRIAETWNRTLQTAANRNSHEVLEKFWFEMKSRLVDRYGSLSAAFRHVDTSHDGKISFPEFVEMLRMINLPLDVRVTRSIFDKASHGAGDLHVNTLRGLLMERVIQRCRIDFRGFNRTQEHIRAHIHAFLNQAANTNESTLRAAADRLQRKVTVDFCREFWQVLRESLAKVHSDGDLERSLFLQAASSMIGFRLADVEVMFLMRIFDRIDVRRTGSIHLRILLTALLLMSEERDTETKLHFLFEVFDTDSDGCLLYEQILDMVRCICAQRHIIEDAPSSVTVDFQEELAQQDGQRLYECLFWHLQRTGRLDSDIVTWKELWLACEKLPEVVNAVIPGLFRIHWVMQPPAEENDLKVQAEQPRTSSVACSAAQRLGPSPRPGTGDHERRASRRASQRSSISAWHGNAHDKGLADSRQTSKVVAWEAPPREKDSVVFKRAVTNRFVSSLRNSGEVRYAELQDGFKSVEELVAGKRDSLLVEDADAPSPTGIPTSNSPLSVAADTEMRPSSAGTIPRSSSDMARPGSSSSMQPGRKGARVLQRVKSAPAPVQKQLDRGGGSSALGSRDSQHQAWTPGRPKSNLGNGRIPGSGAELPSIDTQKWGLEAADRFKMLSVVKASRNNRHHIKGSCGGGDLLGYKCQLCRSQHTMLTSF